MNNIEKRLLRILKDQKKRPVTIREITRKLRVTKSQREEFDQAVKALKATNQLMEKDGKLILAAGLGLVPGTVVKVNETFGFAHPDDWDKDVFVGGRKLAGSMPGDRVLLKISRGSGELREGEVFKITEYSDKPFTGVLEFSEHNEPYVVPDRYVKFPLWVAKGGLETAKAGDKVMCRLVRKGRNQTDFAVHVVQVFGSGSSAAVCAESILAEHEIVRIFPHEVLEQAKAISGLDGIHPKELAARTDLRDLPIFTIDSADSKDLDDAVSLRKLETGWELGVHIADVSYYVTSGTPLDNEAFVRGTSVYFADSVVPMLPPELSNGICSLNPNEDRLTVSSIMRLSDTGKIESFRFEKTVIRSRVKGVYSEINEILAGTADEKLLTKYDGLTEIIANMRILADALRTNRFGRGSVNLETTESKVILDENGRAADIVCRVQGESENIIEEFMLTANEAAATFALERKIPFVFRVHDNPSPDKTAQLYALLAVLGVKAYPPKNGVKPRDFSHILDLVKDTELHPVVNTMVLRSMAKAKYSELCSGHFGLALKNYTHFTSPIRRYPDLLIHRIISAYLTGMKHENISKRFTNYVVTASRQSTEREVAAMTAERDCVDCYKAEYMEKHIGEEFDGVIVSVVSYGVYVQLENTVEGLVHLSALPEGRWEPDSSLALTEQVTGRSLRIGQQVRVKVAAADVSAGTIDFVLQQ